MRATTTHTIREELILGELRRKPKTANEVIDSIFKKDLKKGASFVLRSRHWKFYTHLNKLFSPLMIKGIIAVSGSKIGPTGKDEKIWRLA